MYFRLIRQGFQKRLLFPGFGERLDKNPKTGKSGVRYYGKIETFILKKFERWFHKEYIKDIKIVKKTGGVKVSKTHHLSKASLDKWLRRNRIKYFEKEAQNCEDITLEMIVKKNANIMKEFTLIENEIEKLEENKDEIKLKLQNKEHEFDTFVDEIETTADKIEIDDEAVIEGPKKEFHDLVKSLKEAKDEMAGKLHEEISLHLCSRKHRSRCDDLKNLH